MRVALRAVMIGDGGQAAAARSLRDGLVAAGVDVVVEARDTGVPVTPADGPAPPERSLPVDAHLQWCIAADLDASVAAPARVVRLIGAETLARGDVSAIASMDECWVGSDRERVHLIGLGVPGDRVVVLPDPVHVPSPLPDPPPGAHGDLFVALAPTPDELTTIVATWIKAVPADADTTLLVCGDPGIRQGVVDVVQRVLGSTGEIADLMVITDRLTDAERLGLIGAAHTAIGADPRHELECRALGVRHVAWGDDPPALASLFRHRRGETPIPADARLSADAVAAGAVRRLQELAAGRQRGHDRGRARIAVGGEILAGTPGSGLLRDLARAMIAQGAVDIAVRRSAEETHPRRSGAAVPRSLRWASGRDQDPDLVLCADPMRVPPTGADHRVAVVQWGFGGAPADWVDAAGTRIDEYWVAGDHVREGFLSAGVPAERIAVVPPGCAVDATFPLAPRRSRGRDPLRIGWWGTPGWESGLDLVVAAHRLAAARLGALELIVAPADHRSHPAHGVPPVNVLQDAEAAPGVTVLPGAGRRTQPRPPLECDVLVWVPRADADGEPVRRAMAAGIPVIVPDSGGAREFLGFESPLQVEAREHPLPQGVSGVPVLGEPRIHEVGVDALADAFCTLADDPHPLVAAAEAGLDAASRRGWLVSAGIAAERIRRALDTVRGWQT